MTENDSSQTGIVCEGTDFADEIFYNLSNLFRENTVNSIIQLAV